MKNLKYAIPLLLLPLLIGSALRLIGIDHGRPDMVYHPDVAKQTMVAIRTCNNNIKPHRSFTADFRRTLYPYGTAIIMAKTMKTISRILGNNDLLNVHRWNWALYMRYLASSTFMLSALFAIWFLWRSAGIIPSLLAGLLLVTEPINTQYSHYAMNDVPLTAVLIIAWIFSALMEKEKTYIPIFSLLCGFTLGIAFNIKYQAVLGGIFPLVAWILLTKKKSWRWLLASLATVGIGGIIGLLWTNPLLRAEPGYFFQTLPEFMHWQSNILKKEIPFQTKLTNNIVYLFQYLSTTGIFLILIGPIWAIYALITKKISNKDKVPIISATAFVIIITLILVVSRDFLFMRENDLIPILSFCILLTAFCMAKIIPEKITLTKKNIPALAIYVCVVVTISAFTITSLLDSRALGRTDTRLLASQWCHDNIQAGKTVMRERYTLGMNKEGVKEHRSRYIGTNYKNVDVVITSSKAYRRFYEKHSPYYNEPAQQPYNDINKNWKKTKLFQDRELYFAHPTITVFEKPEKK